LSLLLGLEVAVLAQNDQIAWFSGASLGGRDDVMHLEALLGAAEEAGSVASEDSLAHG